METIHMSHRISLKMQASVQTLTHTHMPPENIKYNSVLWFSCEIITLLYNIYSDGMRLASKTDRQTAIVTAIDISYVHENIRILLTQSWFWNPHFFPSFAFRSSLFIRWLVLVAFLFGFRQNRGLGLRWEFTFLFFYSIAFASQCLCVFVCRDIDDVFTLSMLA